MTTTTLDRCTRGVRLALAVALLTAGCATAPVASRQVPSTPPASPAAPAAPTAPSSPAAPTAPAEVGGTMRERAAPGADEAYLAPGSGIDGVAFLPPPPVPGSAAQAHDDEAARAMLPLRDGPRWQLALQDAKLDFPGIAGTYACALGVAITPEATPATYRLLRRSNQDASRARRAPKDRWRRPRPFMANGQPTCTPLEEPALRVDGSYPSGHATRGWLWALVLAEAAPERAQALLERGRAYGESRMVCNLHWRSDVLASRDLATATFARLHGSPEFRADVEAARAELAAARARGDGPGRDCAAEAAALAQRPPVTP